MGLEVGDRWVLLGGTQREVVLVCFDSEAKARAADLKNVQFFNIWGARRLSWNEFIRCLRQCAKFHVSHFWLNPKTELTDENKKPIVSFLIDAEGTETSFEPPSSDFKAFKLEMELCALIMQQVEDEQARRRFWEIALELSMKRVADDTLDQTQKGKDQ